MIEGRAISISFGSKSIVNNVDFAAYPGELTAIVGPNGSGKTTLLRALCGELPYRGRISFNGRDLSAMLPISQASLRAVLPQETTLSFPFTVREIVKLGLIGGYAGTEKESTEDLPEQALAAVDLAGFAGRFYQELSGGERQRVQLARVLCQVWCPVVAGQPRYLLLDEPVSSLDIKHQLTIMNIARDFARRGGGVVAILHDLNLTAMYADKVLVLQQGRHLAFGTPASILDDDLIQRAFNCGLRVGVLPRHGTPFVLPQSVCEG
ncbi:MAG: heme ABC transporter ATP-binding protein [Rhizobiaceae bacterium]